MTIENEMAWRKSSRCESSGCVEVRWVKASECGESSHCVEVADGGTAVQVRQSLAPDGPVLTFTRDEWDVFTAGVKNGDFD